MGLNSMVVASESTIQLLIVPMLPPQASIWALAETTDIATVAVVTTVIVTMAPLAVVGIATATLTEETATVTGETGIVTVVAGTGAATAGLLVEEDTAPAPLPGADAAILVAPGPPVPLRETMKTALALPAGGNPFA